MSPTWHPRPDDECPRCSVSAGVATLVRLAAKSALMMIQCTSCGFVYSDRTDEPGGDR